MTVDTPVIAFDTTSVTLDNSGKATFTFRTLDVQDDAVVRVTVTTGAVVVNRTIAVKGTGVTPDGVVVTPGAVTSLVNSIAFTSAAPKNISLKGMGGAGRSETSIVTFVVKDRFGNPIANQTVDFSLDTTVGGIALSIPNSVSNTNGLVQTVVSSGTTATTALVTATVRGTSIKIKSESLVISTGIPHQDGMSVSLGASFPEALDFDNITVPVQVMLADHFGNPVPDNTAIYFSAYGGSIEPAGFTTNGIATVKWRSQNPRPADGKARLLIYALGEESFIDANGSGLAEAGEFTDTGEAFLDLNGNGTRDTNEPFIDFNGDGLFNGGDGKFNGVLQGIAYKGAATSKHIFFNNVITMSGSSAAISSPNPATIALAPSLGSSAITDVTVVITDSIGNPMPEGTTVAVNYKLCTIGASSKSFTISQKGDTKFITSLENQCSASGSAGFTVSTTTPKGQKAEKTFILNY